CPNQAMWEENKAPIRAMFDTIERRGRLMFARRRITSDFFNAQRIRRINKDNADKKWLKYKERKNKELEEKTTYASAMRPHNDRNAVPMHRSKEVKEVSNRSKEYKTPRETARTRPPAKTTGESPHHETEKEKRDRHKIAARDKRLADEREVEIQVNAGKFIPEREAIGFKAPM